MTLSDRASLNRLWQEISSLLFLAALWRHLCSTPIPSIDVHRYYLVKFKHQYLVIALVVRAYAKIRCAKSSRPLFSLDTNWTGISKYNEFFLSFYFIFLHFCCYLLMGNRTNNKPLIQNSQFCPKMPILNSLETRTRTQRGCLCRTHIFGTALTIVLQHSVFLRCHVTSRSVFLNLTFWLSTYRQCHRTWSWSNSILSLKREYVACIGESEFD